MESKEQQVIIELKVNDKILPFPIGKLQYFEKDDILLYEIPKAQQIGTNKTFILVASQQIDLNNFLLLIEVRDTSNGTIKHFLFNSITWRNLRLSYENKYVLKEFKEGYLGFNYLARKYLELELN
ncbi:hypothetical protein COF68_05760 [Bacillus toyonensis]|uniref:hypothetical protein n=1 Tax=Bacillus toyonensis TaxID=155322 RepID=UPI000BFC2A1E|nr:hypothetical protein [Bacillus toyonensis]PHE64346.1 hypothetical protein COF68_05760 [Bacillus toyonensis]